MLVKRKEKKERERWQDGKVLGTDTLRFLYKYFSVIHLWITRNVESGRNCRFLLGSVAERNMECVCVCVWGS